MKSNKLILLLVCIGLNSLAYAQTCSSSAGVDLSKKGGSFAGLPARDQGQLGTCYAHSGSDLISSYLKIGRINIYQTAVANDTSMSGGSPGDVVTSFAKLGWACTNTNLFSNLFPSVQNNIIGELQETFPGTPIFYTNNAFDKGGIARQKRIALAAANLARAKAPVGGVVAQQTDAALKKYHALNKQISALGLERKKLEAKKSMFSSNTEINQQIAKLNQKIEALSKLSKAAHEKYANGVANVETNMNLDELSEAAAAESVYSSIHGQHQKFKSIMKKYGLDHLMPTLADFIVDRVHYDPKLQYSYAGAMYPYKLVKKAMDQTCPAYEKSKIPSTIVGMSMSKRKHSSQAIEDKIDSLLEKNRQAVSVSFQSSLLTGRDGEHHAVNIIGCRTNGNLTEYLLQNSWGQGCSSYKSSLQSKCSQGRVWVPSTGLMSSLTEINWVTGK